MDIRALDKKHIWHPFTQMKTIGEHIPIVKGEKEWLYDDEGNRFIDAISSWWVNMHGHAHPYIAERIYEQLKTLEHVIFAGFTHEPATELCHRLSAYTPKGIDRFFFSDNGSTAVEIGIKMAIQSWHNRGIKRQTIIALEHAYHGDTFGAMSVGARSSFFEAFEDYLFKVVTLPVPTEGNEATCLEALEKILKTEEVAAFVYEPLIQGSGGMNMYTPEILEAILSRLKEKEVVLVADEVMTGFYRTGKFFASLHMETPPDIVCMSKGLTGGTLPMALTACNETIYKAFWSDDKSKTLYHGHSFTGNPVGCAAALASLDLIEKEACIANIKAIEASHHKFLKQISSSPYVKNAKITGTIIRFEVDNGEATGYNNSIRNQVVEFCSAREILIRPLGNVVYIMPPYCIEPSSLDTIYTALSDFLQQL